MNPRKYRRYVRGDVIVSLAGIATNLVLFVLFTGALRLIGVVGRCPRRLADTMGILQRMAQFGMSFNLILAFFNLIPIPPLDGSHVFYHLLPPAAGSALPGVRPIRLPPDHGAHLLPARRVPASSCGPPGN